MFLVAIKARRWFGRVVDLELSNAGVYIITIFSPRGKSGLAWELRGRKLP